MMALKTFMVVLLAVACLTPALVVKEAQAAPAWYAVWVNAAGQDSASKYATVTDSTGTVPALNLSTFPISATYDAEAMLYTARMAMAGSKRALIWVDLAATTPQITSLYMMDK